MNKCIIIIFTITLCTSYIFTSSTPKVDAKSETKVDMKLRQLLDDFASQKEIMDIIKKGANPNIGDSEDNQTALHRFFILGDTKDLDYIKFLLLHKANPLQEDNYGQAPLDSFILYNEKADYQNTEIIKYLIKATGLEGRKKAFEILIEDALATLKPDILTFLLNLQTNSIFAIEPIKKEYLDEILKRFISDNPKIKASDLQKYIKIRDIIENYKEPKLIIKQRSYGTTQSPIIKHLIKAGEKN